MLANSPRNCSVVWPVQAGTARPTGPTASARRIADWLTASIRPDRSCRLGRHLPDPAGHPRDDRHTDHDEQIAAERRGAGDARWNATRQEPLGDDDLDRPEQRRRRDHRFAGAPDDPGRRHDDRLADEEDRERGDLRPTEPLAEERDGEEGDPDEQRLVDERGGGRACLGETREKQQEGDAAADDAEDEEAAPLAWPGRPGAVVPPPALAARPTRSPAATAFFSVVKTAGSGTCFTAKLFR